MFSDLYCDVKPTIYQRIGWNEYPAPTVYVDVANFSASPHFSNADTTTFEDGEVAKQVFSFLLVISLIVVCS